MSQDRTAFRGLIDLGSVTETTNGYPIAGEPETLQMSKINIALGD